MRYLAIFLLLVSLGGCAALLTPEQRAAQRDLYAQERAAIQQELSAGVITEEQARRRLLILDGAEFGVDLEEHASSNPDWSGALRDLLLLGLAVGGSMAGVRVSRGAPEAVRKKRQQQIEAKAVEIMKGVKNA